MRLVSTPILSFINMHIIDYPTPNTLNYFWGFGSLAGIFLVIQILTGVFLSMHYTPEIEWAFDSIEHITRDVKNGWLLRYAHANGASFFFIVVYCHIARGLYFMSYKRIALWISGVVILILMMGTAFIGYVLPWGQMSFWGATVITNLVTAIPQAGIKIAEWLWGGFSIDNATLKRFYTLHYLLPFILAGLSLTHLSLLHIDGSTNPLSLTSTYDKIPFYPYFFVKDLFGLMILSLFFGYFVFFDPNTLGHPDNYVRADSLKTPAHIVPEWYFLIFYCILRSIPHKAGGVICMFAALLVLGALPFYAKFKIRSPRFSELYQFFFFVFIVNTMGLVWLGAQEMEEPYMTLGRIGTTFYFAYFLIIVPFLAFKSDYDMKSNESPFDVVKHAILVYRSTKAQVCLYLRRKGKLFFFWCSWHMTVWFVTTNMRGFGKHRRPKRPRGKWPKKLTFATHRKRFDWE